MSAIFKGYQGVTLVSDEPYFDPESGIEYRDQTFAGSKVAIFGLATLLRAQNRSYHTANSGPVYSLTTRINFTDTGAIDLLDRYEISTESFTKSIFEHQEVIAESEEYDGLLSEGQKTFKQWAEESAETKIAVEQTSQSWPVQTQVIRHLRNGVTGFEFDAVSLRRYRRIDLTYAYAAGKVNLSDSQVVFTTPQLNLPSNVAFSVPSTPVDPSLDYRWGWKIRGQRVEIVGSDAEQTFELLFAPWSNLLYADSGGNLDW